MKKHFKEMNELLREQQIEHFLLDERLNVKDICIIKGVVRGLSNAEIALELNLSVRTVKNMLTGIYRCFNVRSRAQLIVKCFQDWKEQ